MNVAVYESSWSPRHIHWSSSSSGMSDGLSHLASLLSEELNPRGFEREPFALLVPRFRAMATRRRSGAVLSTEIWNGGVAVEDGLQRRQPQRRNEKHALPNLGIILNATITRAEPPGPTLALSAPSNAALAAHFCMQVRENMGHCLCCRTPAAALCLNVCSFETSTCGIERRSTCHL